MTADPRSAPNAAARGNHQCVSLHGRERGGGWALLLVGTAIYLSGKKERNPLASLLTLTPHARNGGRSTIHGPAEAGFLANVLVTFLTSPKIIHLPEKLSRPSGFSRPRLPCLLNLFFFFNPHFSYPLSQKGMGLRRVSEDANGATLQLILRGPLNTNFDSEESNGSR